MALPEQHVLITRLSRYPADRYPVQHATTQFHLGSLLLQAGEAVPAVPALTAARDAFGRAGMRLEQAKATVMLGVALRTAGRLADATSAFDAAGAALGLLERPAEQAAAAYNLGLVRQDREDLKGARRAWDQARSLFLQAGLPRQAGTAAREHGASLLSSGRVAEALPLLDQSLTLAERAGDEVGAGAAANTLGLARLAAQEPSAAVEALRRALGAFPPSTRPDDHAMVRANLALAYEQLGRDAHARLVARQALALPAVAPPVRAQAQQLLDRLPAAEPDDLFVVLDEQPREQWTAVVRGEVLRVTETPVDQRYAMVRDFADGLLTRPGASYELAEVLLAVVLELPPRTYRLLVSALVAACAGRAEPDTERLRAVFGSAMARFALPQWQRLAESLNAAAEASGQPGGWR